MQNAAETRTNEFLLWISKLEFIWFVWWGDISYTCVLLGHYKQMKKYDFAELVTWMLEIIYNLNCWERLIRTFLCDRKDVNILIKPKIYFSFRILLQYFLSQYHFQAIWRIQLSWNVILLKFTLKSWTSQTKLALLLKQWIEKTLEITIKLHW